MRVEGCGILLGAILALIILYIPYRIICAWCGRDLGPIYGTYEDSHGICEPCKDDLLSED